MGIRIGLAAALDSPVPSRGQKRISKDEVMIQARASVPTNNAASYVLRLCKTWGEGVDVDFRERQGVVHFGSAVATLAPSEDHLVVTILAHDLGDVERLQAILSERADRLARKEGPFKFDWQNTDLRVHAL